MRPSHETTIRTSKSLSGDRRSSFPLTSLPDSLKREQKEYIATLEYPQTKPNPKLKGTLDDPLCSNYLSSSLSLLFVPSRITCLNLATTFVDQPSVIESFGWEKYRFSLVPRICIYHHISGRIRPLSLGTNGDDRSLRYFQHLLPVHPFDVGHLWPAVDDQKTPILNLSATGSSWSIVRYSTRNRIRRHRRSPLRRSLVIDTGNQDWHPKSLYSDRGNR